MLDSHLIPGPGQYKTKIFTTGHDVRTSQLHGKIDDPNGKYNENLILLDPARIAIKQDTPGPGTYGFGVELSSTGVYALSTVKNSKAANFSPTKSRFDDS